MRDLCTRTLAQRKLPVENRLGSGDFDPRSNKIKVMTMHASKGLDPATLRRVTVQRAPISLHRRPVRRSLTGWLPRQKKRHSARSRRIQRGEQTPNERNQLPTVIQFIQRFLRLVSAIPAAAQWCV